MKTLFSSTALLQLKQRRTHARGFTLLELMVAIAILGVGSGIFYDAFITNFVLTAKNTALNRGNTDIQKSYYKLLTGMESAAIIVDCANYDQTTKTFTSVAGGTWANSVRYMRIIPISLYVLPDDGSGYNVSNPPLSWRSVYLSSTTKTVTLSFNKNSNPSMVDGSGRAVGISSGARLFPAFPYVTETVTGGNTPKTNKPGLSIASINTSTSEKLVLTMTNALGANSFKDCNRAYLLVESAFAIIQPVAGGPKSLIYISDTSQLATSTYSPLVICDSLDSDNQVQPSDPSTTGGVAGNFCLPSGSDALQVLLPIRSREYGNSIKQRNATWINLNTRFRQRQDL